MKDGGNVDNFAFFSNEKILRMRCTVTDNVKPVVGRIVRVSKLGDAVDGCYQIESAEPGKDDSEWVVQMRKVKDIEAARKIYRREVIRLRHRVKDERAREFIDALDSLTRLRSKKRAP